MNEFIFQRLLVFLRDIIWGDRVFLNYFVDSGEVNLRANSLVLLEFVLDIMELVERLKTQLIVFLMDLCQQVCNKVILFLQLLVLILPFRSILNFGTDSFEVSNDLWSHSLRIIKLLLHLMDLLLQGRILTSQECDSAVDVFDRMGWQRDGLGVKLVELSFEIIDV